MKLVVLLQAYFNYEKIDRTLKSINSPDIEIDIIFLECPSKYSEEIYNIGKKYNIKNHFKCSENIAGEVFTLFIKNNIEFIKSYDYVATTEGDVVLDNGSISEAIYLLEKYNENYTSVCSVDLHLNLPKYPIKFNDWVPTPIDKEDHLIGPTGFQFILFRPLFLLNFVNSCLNKEICAPIALGCNNYTSLSDTNLSIFCKRAGVHWIRTKFTKLDHIGWEEYVENNSEYVKEKELMLKSKKIRHNINIDNFDLIKLY